MVGVLDGFRVLDLTSVLAGPFPTLLMAEMGADVIKVEPLSGDPVRTIGPFRNAGMGGLFLHANRGKRSLALDLKSEAGRHSLLEVARNCDVFVHNMRPQAIARLRLEYQHLREVRPEIIYAAITGYGADGPYTDKPAYDDLIQGACGLAGLQQRASGGLPRYAPVAIADRYVGMSAFSAILAAVIHRLRTGRGQSVNIPMFETMAHLVLSDHMGGETFSPALGPPGYGRLLSADRRPYPTKDGFICAMMYSDGQWRRFFSTVQREELADQPRFASMTSRSENIDELYSIVCAILKERNTQEWIQILGEADIPVMTMHTLDSLLEDPQLAAVGLMEWFDHPTEGRIRAIRTPSVWSETQPLAGRPAPQLGQHTREVLLEIGLSAETVDTLIADGIAMYPT